MLPAGHFRFVTAVQFAPALVVDVVEPRPVIFKIADFALELRAQLSGQTGERGVQTPEQARDRSDFELGEKRFARGLRGGRTRAVSRCARQMRTEPMVEVTGSVCSSCERHRSGVSAQVAHGPLPERIAGSLAQLLIEYFDQKGDRRRRCVRFDRSGEIGTCEFNTTLRCESQGAASNIGFHVDAHAENSQFMLKQPFGLQLDERLRGAVEP